MSDAYTITPWETDLSPVDPVTTELEHRARLQLPAHARNIETQTLDALLRIEELLQKLVRAKGLEDLGATDGMELKDLFYTVEPTSTPLMETLKDAKPTTKGKRK